MNNNTQVYAFLEKLWHQYPDLAKNDSQASLKKLWLILLLGGTTYYSLYINSAEWLYITLNVFILCVIFLQLVFIVVSFLGLITVYSYEQQADFNGKLKIRQAFDKRYLSYNVMNYDIITSQRIAYMVCLAAVIGMLFSAEFYEYAVILFVLKILIEVICMIVHTKSIARLKEIENNQYVY